MSLTRKIAITAAFVFTGLLLTTAIQSRKSFDLLATKVIESNSGEQSSLGKLTIINNTSDKKTAAEVKFLLEKKLPGMQINDIEASPMAGIYQAFIGGELIYVSGNADYIFTGNLLELAEGQPINHTQIAMANQDAKQAPKRAETIAQINESEMVIYKAKNEQFVITVFTDVDCAYCRKLHKEIPLLNNKGITVRYLAYPRAGIGSDAYDKMVSVWCADDRLAAMDDAKLNRQFGNFGKKTCINPIAKHFRLTRDFNLSGTPSLILPDGELIGGYLPANDLYQHLVNKKAQVVAMNSAQ